MYPEPTPRFGKRQTSRTEATSPPTWPYTILPATRSAECQWWFWQTAGGVGIGKAFNGGFGLVLDGARSKDRIIRSALEWDVINGIARRSWSRNENAMKAASEWNRKIGDLGHITLPYIADEKFVDRLVNRLYKK